MSSSPAGRLRRAVAVTVGRAARVATRLRGGGSALPGYLVRRIAPSFIADVVAQWPHGVIIVLGSNGKSTTTNMVTEIVRAHGLTVFTNPSGANLPQGIASSMLAEVSLSGKLPADIGVIEVDEAFGLQIARELKPSAAVILNLQIDQIYRFYEPERVRGMFEDILGEVSGSVVLNRDDAFLAGLGAQLEDEGRLTLTWFGTDPQVMAAAPHGQVAARDYSRESSTTRTVEVATEVLAHDGNDVTLRFGDRERAFRMPARGLHYAIDSAAAISLVAATLGDRFSFDTAVDALASAKTVYGRGEIMRVGEVDVEVLLLKNLASLQMNLDYLSETPDSVVFAFDDGSKDPSWLYAADLSKLGYVDVVSGPKAAFVALRLAYAGIPFGTVEPDIDKAIDLIMASPKPASGTRTLILDYDQMILTRRKFGYRDLEAGAA